MRSGSGINPKYKKLAKIRMYYVILKNAAGVYYNGVYQHLKAYDLSPSLFASNDNLPTMFKSKDAALKAFNENFFISNSSWKYYIKSVVLPIRTLS